MFNFLEDKLFVNSLNAQASKMKAQQDSSCARVDASTRTNDTSCSIRSMSAARSLLSPATSVHTRQSVEALFTPI